MDFVRDFKNLNWGMHKPAQSEMEKQESFLNQKKINYDPISEYYNRTGIYTDSSKEEGLDPTSATNIYQNFGKIVADSEPEEKYQKKNATSAKKTAPIFTVVDGTRVVNLTKHDMNLMGIHNEKIRVLPSGIVRRVDYRRTLSFFQVEGFVPLYQFRYDDVSAVSSEFANTIYLVSTQTRLSMSLNGLNRHDVVCPENVQKFLNSQNELDRICLSLVSYSSDPREPRIEYLKKDSYPPASLMVGGKRIINLTGNSMKFDVNGMEMILPMDRMSMAYVSYSRCSLQCPLKLSGGVWMLYAPVLHSIPYPEPNTFYIVSREVKDEMEKMGINSGAFISPINIRFEGKCMKPQGFLS